MLAVPPAVLEMLQLRAGATVGLVVDGGRLIVEPRPRRRYTLDELLAQCDPSAELMQEDREWLEAQPVVMNYCNGARRYLSRLARCDQGPWQQGRRPVLVVSPGAFNRLTKVPIVLPITSGGRFARTAGFAVSLTDAGARTSGVIRCDQSRALDLNARDPRRLESVREAIIDEVSAKLAPLFD